MQMSKRDRIAVVVSIGSGPPLLLFSFAGGLFDMGPIATWVIGVVAYWGYRFIKNDISFLKIDEDSPPAEGLRDAPQKPPAPESYEAYEARRRAYEQAKDKESGAAG